MEAARMIEALQRNEGLRAGLIEGIGDEQARWNPAPGAWSILEVTNHLHDEERDDFRLRLDLLLHHPGTPWPGIDPEGWCLERTYNDRDPAESLERFRTERRKSITWLRSLEEPAWEKVYHHPRLGDLRAGDLLASWLVHDYLHARQLTKLHYAHAQTLMQPFDGNYAGPW